MPDESRAPAYRTVPVLPNVVLRIGGGKRLARGFEPRLHAVVHKERQQIGRVGRFLGPCLKGFGVFQHVGAKQFFGPDVAPDRLIPDKLRSRAELRQGFRHFQDRAEKLLGPLRIDGELLPGQQRRPMPMLPYRRRPKPDRRKPPTKPSPHLAGGIRPLRVPKVPAETTSYPQVRRTSSPICRSSTLPSILPCTGAGPAPQKCILKSEAQERHPPRINFIHNGPTVSAQGVLAPSFIQEPGSPRQNFPGSPNHGPYTGTREKTLSHPRLKKPPSLRRRAQSFPNCSSVP